MGTSHSHFVRNPPWPGVVWQREFSLMPTTRPRWRCLTTWVNPTPGVGTKGGATSPPCVMGITVCAANLPSVHGPTIPDPGHTRPLIAPLPGLTHQLGHRFLFRSRKGPNHHQAQGTLCPLQQPSIGAENSLAASDPLKQPRRDGK